MTINEAFLVDEIFRNIRLHGRLELLGDLLGLPSHTHDVEDITGLPEGLASIVAERTYLTGAGDSLVASLPDGLALDDVIAVKYHSSTAVAKLAYWKCTDVAASLPASAVAGELSVESSGKLYVSNPDNGFYFEFEIMGDADVLAFGAVGDSTTNDGAALLVAVSTGKDVKYPEGYTFLIDNVSIEPLSNQRFYGGGRLYKTVVAPGYLSDFITVDSVSHVIITGLEFECAGTARDYAIYAINSSNLDIRNCKFVGNETPIFIAKNCNVVNIFDNYMAGGQQGIATGGEKADAQAYGPVTHVVIARNYIAGMTNEALDINWDSHKVIMADNTCYNCGSNGTGNEIIDIGGGECTDILVHNNLLDGNGVPAGGIQVKLDTNHVYLVNNAIRGLDLADLGRGIRVTGCSHAHVIGNSIIDAYVGISVDTDCIDVTVTHNHIVNCAFDGIVVSVGANTGIKINNNYLDGVASTAEGIDITNVTDFQVMHNTVKNFDADGIIVRADASEGEVDYNSVSYCDDGIVILGSHISASNNRSSYNSNTGLNLQGDYIAANFNRVTNNAQVTASAYGITISGGADFLSLIGNKVYDTQGVKTQNGIRFLAACDRVLCTNNFSYGNKATNITGEGTLTNSTVTDNITA